MRLRPFTAGLLSIAVAGLLSSSGFAQYVPLAKDVAGVRTPLQNEGYLIHKVNDAAGINRFGDEYTGWIDVRHPARASVAATELSLGYDMSDHVARIRTTTLTDSTGAVAAPNQDRDFDYMNRVYVAQGGFSVVQTGQRAYTSGGAVAGGNPVNFSFPIDTGGTTQNTVDSQFGLAANNLVGGSATGTMDMFYHRDLDNDAGSAYRGYAYFSSSSTRPDGGAGAFRPFIGIATTGGDAAVADTVAHEVGHFILNGPSVDNPGSGGHSNTNTNLMASGDIRWYPGQAAGSIAAGPPQNPPSAILQSLAVVGPTLSTNADGTPKVGGIDHWTGGTSAQSQLRRTFDNTGNAATQSYLTLANNRSAGDRVDFDFLADAGRNAGTGGVATTAPGTIDGVPRADNFAGATPESLYFGIGGSNAGYTTALPADVNKDKTGLGTFGALGNFAGTSFKFADVFSLTTRYGDSDTDPTNAFRAVREGALDYYVTFVDASNASSLGTVLVDFIEGWSLSTLADNYVARWMPTDPNFVPVGLFITALDGTFNGAKYEGHAQIDAVIVGVPEPTALLAVVPISLLLGRRR